MQIVSIKCVMKQHDFEEDLNLNQADVKVM